MKVEIKHNGNTYKVYPVGSKVRHTQSIIEEIESVFITNQGEVIYTLTGINAHPFSAEQIESMVLHQIDFKND